MGFARRIVKELVGLIQEHTTLDASILVAIVRGFERLLMFFALPHQVPAPLTLHPTHTHTLTHSHTHLHTFKKITIELIWYMHH